MNPSETFTSEFSQKRFPIQEKVRLNNLHTGFIKFVQKTYPQFSISGVLAFAELNEIRLNYIKSLLSEDSIEIHQLENDVADALDAKSPEMDRLENDLPPTKAQAMADSVARFGGSWIFILSFGGFLLVWIVLNAFFLTQHRFDPYPFILLNLILSCLAAIQAPIIMMSQNRQEEKDRQRAQQDFKINLKAELEIRLLHKKLDCLINRQQSVLLDVQAVQTEMIKDLIEANRPSNLSSKV